jgi:hypothetical protein
VGAAPSESKLTLEGADVVLLLSFPVTKNPKTQKKDEKKKPTKKFPSSGGFLLKTQLLQHRPSLHPLIRQSTHRDATLGK